MIARSVRAHPARAHPVRTVALILALSVAGGTAWAGDPAEGRGIAERWCSSCHVAGNRSGGTDAVPTLESIANDPRRNPEWLRQWLNDPHPRCPIPISRGWRLKT